MDIDDQLDHVFRLTVLIANDVVAFEAHRFFVFGNHDKFLHHWHYRPAVAAQINKHDLSIIRRVLKRTRESSSGAVLTVSGGVTAATLKVRLPHDQIALFRFSRRGEFTAHELWLLSLIKSLSERAYYSPETLRLLETLHLMFVDQRVFPRSFSAKEILHTYAEKAGILLHPNEFDPAYKSVKQHTRLPKIRITAKLINLNRTELWIAAAIAFPNQAQWSPSRLGERYSLLKPRSIAARVWHKQRPYHTNSYQLDDIAQRIFKDTASHISAPLLYGKEQRQAGFELPSCLGVLSIETSVPNAYSQQHRWALALLASHASWPVGRSLLRTESNARYEERNIHHRTSLALARCISESEVFSILSDGLKKLRYPRGLFSEVSPNQLEIKGGFAWGRNFKRLSRITDRNLTDDETDCQSQAVKTGKPKVVLDPESDTSVNREAHHIARLKPFVVVPLKEPHGKVLFTLHIEREDLAPIGQSDIDIATELCEMGMQALRRIGRTQSLVKLNSELFSEEYPHLDWLFTKLGNHIYGCGVASRYRVFRINGNQQTGQLQCGENQIDKFKGFVLAQTNQNKAVLDALREDRKPVIVVAHKSSQTISPSDEFRVMQVRHASHTHRFKKGDVDEWIEIPIMDGGRLLTHKIVVDNCNRQLTHFPIEDIHELVKCGNTASSLTDVIHYRNLIAQLASEGLNCDVIRHALEDIVPFAKTRYHRHVDPKRILIEAASTLHDLAILSRRADSTSSIRKDFQLIESLVRPFSANITLRVATPPENLHSLPTKADDALSSLANPLPWILMKFLMNSIRSFGGLPAERTQEVRVTFRRVDKDRAEIDITDNGPPLPCDIVEAWKHPPRLIENAAGNGQGIAYARILASKAGWPLRLVSSAKKVLRLRINVVELGKK